MNQTVENFSGRFRVSNRQAARIALTNVSNEVRNSLVGMDTNQVAKTLDAYNKNGQPLMWTKDVVSILNHEGWNDSLALNREGAFQEFLAAGGPVRGRTEKGREIPDSVIQDPELTLENFAQKMGEATGQKGRRFRVSPEQNRRIKAGELTREQAFQEFINERR